MEHGPTNGVETKRIHRSRYAVCSFWRLGHVHSCHFGYDGRTFCLFAYIAFALVIYLNIYLIYLKISELFIILQGGVHEQVLRGSGLHFPAILV